MVLIVERRDTAPTTTAADPGPRSLDRALRHMHWHYSSADASPLMQRRPMPLASSPDGAGGAATQGRTSH